MTVERYIIVDGYNVIYASEALKGIMPDNKSRARESLAELIKAIHSIESVRIAVVFDSGKERLEIEYPFGDKSFEFIFAPASLTADGVIERILVRAPKKDLVTVVSNDNLVREATRSNGALAIRPNDLFDWVTVCNRRLMDITQSRDKDKQKPFENRLDIDLN